MEVINVIAALAADADAGDVELLARRSRDILPSDTLFCLVFFSIVVFPSESKIENRKS
jgi:hypothetical protein